VIERVLWFEGSLKQAAFVEVSPRKGAVVRSGPGGVL
jgi:hypothetical protein